MVDFSLASSSVIMVSFLNEFLSVIIKTTDMTSEVLPVHTGTLKSQNDEADL